MKEDLLQFIWKFRYFKGDGLKTTSGEAIEIVHPGTQNFDQGPDFLNAKIKIDDTLWIGNVEIHTLSRQWEQHQHQFDERYNNVVLHVVWQHDKDIADATNVVLPTLELKDKVSRILLERYKLLMEKSQTGPGVFIPCAPLLKGVDDFRWQIWKSRLATERLEYKTAMVFEVFEQTGHNWEETLWRIIAKNFGGKMNGQLFQRVAETVPQNILAKHRQQPIVIEAILLGQAGFLRSNFSDAYPRMLQKEFEFYKKKYRFELVDGSACFARMRPASFPTVRMAQLASLITISSHLFSKIRDFESAVDVMNCLRVTTDGYWSYHYKLDDEPSPNPKEKTLGAQTIENIMINSICPILFAYGMHHKDEGIKEKSIAWLEQINAEKNAITKGFALLGVHSRNAFDSQALIHLKNFYCDKRRCLDCNTGNAILGRLSTEKNTS